MIPTNYAWQKFLRRSSILTKAGYAALAYLPIPAMYVLLGTRDSLFEHPVIQIAAQYLAFLTVLVIHLHDRLCAAHPAIISFYPDNRREADHFAYPETPQYTFNGTTPVWGNLRHELLPLLAITVAPALAINPLLWARPGLILPAVAIILAAIFLHVCVCSEVALETCQQRHISIFTLPLLGAAIFLAPYQPWAAFLLLTTLTFFHARAALPRTAALALQKRYVDPPNTIDLRAGRAGNRLTDESLIAMGNNVCPRIAPTAPAPRASALTGPPVAWLYPPVLLTLASFIAQHYISFFPTDGQPEDVRRLIQVVIHTLIAVLIIKASVERHGPRAHRWIVFLIRLRLLLNPRTARLLISWIIVLILATGYYGVSNPPLFTISVFIAALLAHAPIPQDPIAYDLTAPTAPPHL